MFSAATPSHNVPNSTEEINMALQAFIDAPLLRVHLEGFYTADQLASRQQPGTSPRLLAPTGSQ